MSTSCVTTVWPVAALCVALTAMSAGGTLFALIGPSVPPILKAAWRLCATAILQAPFFVMQARGSDMGTLVRRLPALGAIGVVLAVHFGSWVFGIERTSLTHSLLFVTAHPVILVLAYWVRWLVATYVWGAVGVPHPTALEMAGTILGMVGATLMVVLRDHSDGSGVTLLGDMVSLLGGAAMAAYLEAGRHFRSRLKMPLFLYAFPVTASATIVALIVSAAVELPNASSETASAFGWFLDGRLALLVVGLGLVSGIMGHTLTYLALARLPTLVVSVSLLLEPVVGSLIGAAAGVQGMPGPWTFGGGAILLVGALLVTLGAREEEDEDVEKEAAEDGEEGEETKGTRVASEVVAEIEMTEPPERGEDRAASGPAPPHGAGGRLSTAGAEVERGASARAGRETGPVQTERAGPGRGAPPLPL